MSFLVWAIVGLLAGLKASRRVGASGYGIVDVITGMTGAVVGGWSFIELGPHASFGGSMGAIVVAAVGALLSLVGLHAIRAGVRHPAKCK